MLPLIEDEDLETDTLQRGTIRISIPPYAPWLGALYEVDGDANDVFSSRSLTGAGSRAFLVADRVVLTVFDSGSAQIAQETFDPAAFYFDEAGDGTVGHTLTLPAGTGYTIQAEIYNLDESAIDPMVSGTSEPFAVTEGGETPVAITCIPVSPAELVLDIQQTFTQVSTTMDEATGEPSSLGGETWVSAVVPESGILWIDVDMPDTGFLLAMALYDDQGTAFSMDYGIQAKPLNDANMMTGDGYVYFYGANPGETVYVVSILVGDGSSQDFSLTMADDFYTIRGTITIPGITDESLLPQYSGEFLAPAFNSSMDDWIADGNRIGPMTVSGENLLFDYFFIYDGDETAVLGAGIVDSFTWPLPGDWVGAWDGATGTPMDFVAGTGIEPYHFIGNVTNIDFTMQLIATTPVPASAFPDAVLRAAMEEIIGKSFTGAEGGVTDADLLALNMIDLRNRGEVYTELTGLELCDGVGLVNFDENDLSGCDLGTGPGGLAYEALAGMDSLWNLQLPGCSLDELDFITGAANLGYLNIVGNQGISYTEQLLIDPVNLPNLRSIWYSGNRYTNLDPVDDTEWAALVAKIAGFAELRSLGLVGFGITPGQFGTLYTNVLSTDPAAFTELDFRDGSLDNDSLNSLANLTALEYLGLANNTAVTDISALGVANLATLQAFDLSLTSVTDLSSLQTLHGLGAFSDHSRGYNVNVSYMNLDLWLGTANRDVVDNLIGQGVVVLYEDGNTIVEPAGTGSLEVTVY